MCLRSVRSIELHMRLNLFEYDGLCLEDRLHLTWSVGTQLATLETDECVFILYAVYDYYVELISIHLSDETRITRAVAFSGGNRLDKYLDSVDLSDLLTSVG